MPLHQALWMDLHQATSWWTFCRDVLDALWFQNLILIVTAGIGLWTLRASSLQERRRATVDVLLDALDDKEFIDGRRAVLALIHAGLDIPRLLSKDGLSDRRKVLSLLTRYEYMASGLRERAFDTRIYKRMYYSTVLGDWDALEAFVRALRDDRRIPTLYQEVETLVIDWKKHPLKAYELLAKAPQASVTAPAGASPAAPPSLAPAKMPATPASDLQADLKNPTESFNGQIPPEML